MMPVAAFAGVVVSVIAALAQMATVLVASIILPPYALTTASAGSGGVLHTLRADKGVVEADQIRHGMKGVTNATFLHLSFQFAHKISSSIKIARSASSRFGLSTSIICSQKKMFLRRN